MQVYGDETAISYYRFFHFSLFPKGGGGGINMTIFEGSKKASIG